MTMRKIYRLTSLVLIMLVSACSLRGGAGSSVVYPIDPLAVTYSGSGTDSVAVQGISGPSIIHITAAKGTMPFQLSVETSELINRIGPIDEYRAYEFNSDTQVNFIIKSVRAWSITISPANPSYFSSLEIPGIYKGNGNAVIFLEGEYGVATFKLKPGQDFKAWAFGAGVNQELYITPSGDYQGKSVLPQDAAWVIVSTKEAWSVDIQAPCCKVPPGFKPEYNP